MGLRFRKSVNLGPLRINFSKSGVGYSYGVKGYRVTHKANGGKRTTVSIPGTGISHVTETPRTSPNSRPIAANRGPTTGDKCYYTFIAVMVLANIVVWTADLLLWL